MWLRRVGRVIAGPIQSVVPVTRGACGSLCLMLRAIAWRSLHRFRPVGLNEAGGKSGLHRARWSLTPTGREVRESATENSPPNDRKVRGKGETVR